MHQVYFVRENKRIEVPEGTTVLEASGWPAFARMRPAAEPGPAGNVR